MAWGTSGDGAGARYHAAEAIWAFFARASRDTGDRPIGEALSSVAIRHRDSSAGCRPMLSASEGMRSTSMPR